MFGEALPPNRKERWELLEQFLARWFPPSVDPGVRTSELDASALRLGVPLPAALREWYERQGGRADVWSSQDRFLRPRQLQVAGDLLIFCVENQGVVQWGIPLESLAMPDPPVIVSDPQDATVRHVEHETTSGFALALAVMNAKWSASPAAYHANGQSTADACRAIRGALPRLPFPDLHFPASPTTFHGDDDVIVELHADTWIWATARTRAAVARIRALDGVDWDP
jgi:hypothetical protein